MAFIAAAIPAVIGIFSAAEEKKQAKLAGIRAQGQKNIEAAALDYQAGQVQAAAQQEGLEERRKAKLLASRALAVGAAGGGGVADPSMVNLIGDIEGEGAYRQAAALYRGGQDALRLTEGAGVKRREGELAERSAEQIGKASDIKALGYAAQGASSMYAKYSQPKLSTGTAVN